VSVPDTGRKPGLPDVAVVGIAGAPGSGVDDVLQKLTTSLDGAVVVDTEVSTRDTHQGSKLPHLPGVTISSLG
jgi:uridine kinase